MPTYEYACEECDHQFEEFQSITAKPLKKCPACGQRTLRRLIGTGGGVIFKGSGFYQTDYRSESYKKAAKAESDTAKGSTADSSSKSEKKTESATKTEPTTKTESKPAKPESKSGTRKAG